MSKRFEQGGKEYLIEHATENPTRSKLQEKTSLLNQLNIILKIIAISQNIEDNNLLIVIDKYLSEQVYCMIDELTNSYNLLKMIPKEKLEFAIVMIEKIVKVLNEEIEELKKIHSGPIFNFHYPLGETYWAMQLPKQIIEMLEQN